MGVGAALYMCDVVVKKFTFAISSPDELLFTQLDCVTHNAPVRCLPERKKLSSVMCLIASNIC